MKIGAFADRWLGRLSSAYGLWPLLPTGVVAVIAGYLASGASWLMRFGPFAWWAAGVLAFCLTSAALALLAVAREKWIYAAIQRQRSKDGDAVNPIDATFTSRRLKIADLVRPSTNYIRDKVFTDCQLIGPALVVLEGGSINGGGIINCNWVVVREGAIIANATRFINVTVRGGDISDVTFFIHERDIKFFQNVPAAVLNRTGVAEIDNRNPPLNTRF